MDKQREYIPPADKLIERYAREVCGQLAQRGNSACENPEVVAGLAGYLKFAARLIAKYVNAGHDELLDNHQQRG